MQYAQAHGLAPLSALEVFLWQLDFIALLPLVTWALVRFFAGKGSLSFEDCYGFEFLMFFIIGMVLAGMGIIGILYPLLYWNEHFQPGFVRNIHLAFLAVVTFFFVLWPTGDWIVRTTRRVLRRPSKLLVI